ncbi:unnamed protein product [Effrenium voratum]|nr:unnamed protein product [Effrenium voratum]
MRTAASRDTKPEEEQLDMRDQTFSCTNGVTSLDSHTCTERACATDLSYSLVLGSKTSTETITSQVAHAGTFTVTCATVDTDYDNDITVTCLKGALSADYSACKPACLTTNSAILPLGSNNVDVFPTARMADGESFTKQCSDFGGQHGGTVEVSCSMGVVAVASSCLVGCAADDAYQVDLSFGIFTGRVAADLLDTVTGTADCPVGFSGTVNLQCNAGTLDVTSETCTPLPCPNMTEYYLEYEDVGQHHMSLVDYGHDEGFSVPCSDANPEISGNLQATLGADGWIVSCKLRSTSSR